MDMLPSLCTAMVRANGDSLLLESGRAPYVMSGTHRQDVAKATLSDNALEALVAQIFSGPARDAFRETGRTAEGVDVPSAGLTLKATAERRDGAIVIELRLSLVPIEGSDVAPNLDKLYLFCEERIGKALTTDDHEPLREARKVLAVLLDAWTRIETPAAETIDG